MSVPVVCTVDLSCYGNKPLYAGRDFKDTSPPAVFFSGSAQIAVVPVGFKF